MCTVSREVVIGMIEINHVVQLVGWNEQGSVVRAVGSDASVRVFARLRQPSDVVTDPAPSSVASVDPALSMVGLEALQQSAKILIGG